MKSFERHDYQLARVVLGLAAACVVFYYAWKGGSYDIVQRHGEAIAILWFLALGVTLGLLSPTKLTRGQAAVLALLGTWAIVGGVALSWTESQERTVLELARDLHYLGLVALAYWLVPARSRAAVALGLFGGATAVCAAGVASRLLPGMFETNPVNELFNTDRLNYPLNYWNAVGAWCAMTLTLGLGLATHVRSMVARAAVAASLPVVVTAGYLTYSRTAVIASLLGVLLMIGLGRHRLTAVATAVCIACLSALPIVAVRAHPQIAHATGGSGAAQVALLGAIAVALAALLPLLLRKLTTDSRRMPRTGAQRALAGVGVVVIVAALLVGPALANNAWDSFRHVDAKPGTTDPAARLNSLSGRRYEIWSSSWRAFKSEPLRGVGPGAFEFWWSRDARVSGFERDAHSLYLETLAERGTLGILSLIAALAGLIYVGLRGRTDETDPEVGVQRALVATFLVFLIAAGADWLWECTAVTALGLLSISVAGSRGERTSGELGAGSNGPRRSYGIRAGLAVTALAACAIQVPSLVSTESLRESQAAAAVGMPDAALQSAEVAVASAPWSATARMQRGLVLEAADHFALAARDFRGATAREPTNWRAWLLLARAQAEAHAPRAALESFRTARLLRPHSPFTGTQ